MEMAYVYASIQSPSWGRSHLEQTQESWILACQWEHPVCVLVLLKGSGIGSIKFLVGGGEDNIINSMKSEHLILSLQPGLLHLNSSKN